jgi:hypothetical protein
MGEILHLDPSKNNLGVGMPALFSKCQYTSTLTALLENCREKYSVPALWYKMPVISNIAGTFLKLPRKNIPAL